jgi:hypothetical protein
VSGVADSTTRKTATKKSSPAKKTAKKSTTKRTAKKAADKSTASKTENQSAGTAKKTASARAEAPPSPRHTGSSDRDTDRDGGRGRGTRVAGAARRAVLELTGKPAESITGLSRTDDGWAVEVEVLELERIPRTTDVLATYQVTVDEDGELQGYRRLRRYVRGSPGDE